VSILKKTDKPNSASAKGRRYKHPVPGRNELLQFLRDAGQPLVLDAIMKGLDLRGQRAQAALIETLGRMVRAGQIIENRRHVYCLAEKLELVPGIVSAHRDGFGFVIRDDGEQDVYLSAREMRALIDGDRVAIKVTGRDFRGRPEGRVVEILERGIRDIAGLFIRERGIGLVLPDNPKISHRVLIPSGESGSAEPGQIVVAEILDYPTNDEPPTGRVVRVIGDPSQPGIATDIAIHAHGIPETWPGAVLQEIRRFDQSVPAADIKDRADFRDLPLATIDGADARDFDDAVYCAPAANGWRLVVAIADVAHYVDTGTGLDREAVRRGTSVYFPNRVVPMLPEVLSNELCSLKPDVDRLCMVCDMHVDATGNVTRSRFHDGVMRSVARLTYSQVADFLAQQSRADIPQAVQSSLSQLHALYKALAAARQRRGAIELDIPQTRIELDSAGVVKRILTVPRNDAHRLIEECMIAANVQAGRFLQKHRIPGLFRVHARPDPDRFGELREFLTTLGLKVPHPDHVEPRHFNQLLRQVADRPDAQTISVAMLRSMMHAEYTPKNVGHFGLALETYAHFTSPIRRYPDLLVHRAIRHIVAGGKAGSYRYSPGDMERLGAISSAHERRAEEATRDVEARLKCQFMQDKVGGEFEGIVTGVTNFGVFVQLLDPQVDGLVHVTSLENDYYRFDAGALALIGERTGKRYTLGDRLRVIVARVDLDSRRIDFRLSGGDAASTGQTEGRRGNRTGRPGSRSRRKK
jgi:ribonuclease R